MRSKSDLLFSSCCESGRRKDLVRSVSFCASLPALLTLESLFQESMPVASCHAGGFLPGLHITMCGTFQWSQNHKHVRRTARASGESSLHRINSPFPRIANGWSVFTSVFVSLLSKGGGGLEQPPVTENLPSHNVHSVRQTSLFLDPDLVSL